MSKKLNFTLFTFIQDEILLTLHYVKKNDDRETVAVVKFDRSALV